eukprot:scaffold9662_cov57-Cyclotella_meneghiniana.AAC.1
MLLRYGTDGDELVVLCCDAHSLNAISVGCFVFCLSRGSGGGWSTDVLPLGLSVISAEREAKFILKSCEELKRMI